MAAKRKGEATGAARRHRLRAHSAHRGRAGIVDQAQPHKEAAFLLGGPSRWRRPKRLPLVVAEPEGVVERLPHGTSWRIGMTAAAFMGNDPAMYLYTYARLHPGDLACAAAPVDGARATARPTNTVAAAL